MFVCESVCDPNALKKDGRQGTGNRDFPEDHEQTSLAYASANKRDHVSNKVKVRADTEVVRSVLWHVCHHSHAYTCTFITHTDTHLRNW